MILTQSPTIQKLGYFLFLRDIKQAYTRSRSYLVRDILCWPSPEVIEAYGLAPDTIMHVIKPLYGLAEAGNHWYETWVTYLRENLRLGPSCFDPCQLMTRSKPLAISGVQVDDTIFLADHQFVKLEDEQLPKIWIPSRPYQKTDN